MLDINITAVYQIIGYLVFLIIIHRLLRNPFLKILAERDKRINGTRKDAEKIEADIDSGIEDYETRLKEATLKSMEERGKLKETALAEEKAIIESARLEAQSYLEGIRGEVSASKDTALGTLKEETKSFSREIVDKVLSTKALSILAFLAPAMLLFLPAVAFASSGEEGGGSGMIWKVINFAVLVVALVIIWKKVISGLLTDKSRAIETALEEAAKMKASAEAKEKEYNEKLKYFDSTIKEVQDELKRDGEAEKVRIVEEANEAAIRIKEQTKQLVALEVEKAKAEIRREVGLLSVELAEGILKKELTEEDHKRLAKESLEKIRMN
jgi:F-type H+-transporting ATPase subunit b